MRGLACQDCRAGTTTTLPRQRVGETPTFKLIEQAEYAENPEFSKGADGVEFTGSPWCY